MTWGPAPAPPLPTPSGTGARTSARQRFEDALRRGKPPPDGEVAPRPWAPVGAPHGGLHDGGLPGVHPTAGHALHAALQQARQAGHSRGADRWRLVWRIDDAAWPLTELVITVNREHVQVQLRTASEASYRQLREVLPSLARALREAGLEAEPEVLLVGRWELA